MILCEAHAIRALWFRDPTRYDVFDRCGLPLLIALPALLTSAFRLTTRRWVAEGKMSPNLASHVSQFLGIATFITYVCIFNLAHLAFRTE